MKICVLGNSQAACLKSAWDDLRTKTPEHELTFFAAFGLSLNNLQLAGDRFIAKSEGLKKNIAYTAGKTEVVFADYDIVLIAGAGLGMRTVDTRLSSQVMRSLATDLVKNSLAYRLARDVRAASDKPIYIIHSPLLDERTAGRVQFEVKPYADYAPFLEQAVDIDNARLLTQPERTITLGHYTKLEYSTDAVRLSVSDRGEGIRHKDEDYNHMNAAYGAVRLRELFDLLTHR